MSERIHKAGRLRRNWLFMAILGAVIMLAACSQGQTSVVPEPTQAPLPTSTQIPSPTQAPTETATTVPTATATPTLTPLPGSLVYPIDELGVELPWLPMDDTRRPRVIFFAFNTNKPPFGNAQVRQALAASVDREVIAELVSGYGFTEIRPATNLTPPETMGRDLYNEVGIPFDPIRAKELMADAGYADVSGFPEIVILVNVAGERAPGTYINIANEVINMWNQYLGIEGSIVTVRNFGDYIARLRSDAADVFRLGWAADYNDPDNFLRGIFHSSSEANFGGFSNLEFDQLVEEAERVRDPATRQQLYILAEQILTEEEAALIPLYHGGY